MNVEDYNYELLEVYTEKSDYLMEEGNKDNIDRFIKKEADVNKKYHVIFKYRIDNFYIDLDNEIIILDKEQDNVYIHKKHSEEYEKYSLNKEDIKLIKDKINNKALYKNDVANLITPAVLDGNDHTIKLFNNDDYAFIYGSNLEYLCDEVYSEVKDKYEKEEIEFTKEVMDIIYMVQDILNKNNIPFDMFEAGFEEIEEDE